MASSLASGLHSVDYDMPHVCGVIPIWDVGDIVEALTAQLQDMGNGACTVLAWLPLGVSFLALMSSGLGLRK